MKVVLVGAVDALVESGHAPDMLVTLPVELSRRHSDFADLGQPATAAGVAIHRTERSEAAETLAAQAVLAYETLSETNWNAPNLSLAFLPNVFADISATLVRKLYAFAMFESQARVAPHERSVESLRGLATLRGATVHRSACEAFVLVRHAA